jgi:hypothetical protein
MTRIVGLVLKFPDAGSGYISIRAYAGYGWDKRCRMARKLESVEISRPHDSSSSAFRRDVRDEKLNL